MRSDDDGQTFSEPVEITKSFLPFRPKCNWKVIATGPGHGIQLKNGRLLVPVWLAYGGPGSHGPSVAATVYSDDHGATWQAGDIALSNEGEWTNPNETCAAQLADGRVMLNSRSGSRRNRRLVTTSPDGAASWSRPRFDETLWEPICMASLIRLSETPAHDKNRLLFSNPHSLKRDENGREIPGGRGERKNVSIKLTYDEGETWPVSKTLEPTSSAYSDLAVLADGTILCFYERKGLITIARFNLEWLTDGHDHLARGPSK
jgi:sialidase-1